MSRSEAAATALGGTEKAGGTVRRTVTIVNRRGLHARAAARFVQEAARHDADITVTRNDLAVAGSSIMGLMMLAAALGTDIDIEARGAAAAAAVAALTALVAAGFHED